MEPHVAASVFASGVGWVSVVGDVLSVFALLATTVVLGTTAKERDSRLLASGRAACVTFCGLLNAGGFGGLLTRWAFAVTCVAFLLGLLAVALRYGQGTSLRRYLEKRGGAQQAAWWPAFERGFRRYASTPQREQNPLRRAATRPTSQTTADRRRIARRFPDVITGGRP
jgi:hypothetical protein